jgi:hypothetical protein
VTDTILTDQFIDAFGDDDMTDAEKREFCVGNSHALIVCQYSAVSARCACGSTLILTSDSETLPARLRNRWAHRSVGGAVSIACPPYECECGRRHNVRPV